MRTSGTVQLIVNGVYVTVPREVGFDLFERDQSLLAAGLTERAELLLEEQRRTMLHLLLGAGHLAVIEASDPDGASGSSPGEHDQEVETAAPGDVFIDFDAYNDPDRPAASPDGHRDIRSGDDDRDRSS